MFEQFAKPLITDDEKYLNVNEAKVAVVSLNYKRNMMEPISSNLSLKFEVHLDHYRNGRSSQRRNYCEQQNIAPRTSIE